MTERPRRGNAGRKMQQVPKDFESNEDEEMEEPLFYTNISFKFSRRTT